MVACARKKFLSEARLQSQVFPLAIRGQTACHKLDTCGHLGLGPGAPVAEILTQSNLKCLMVTKGGP